MKSFSVDIHLGLNFLPESSGLCLCLLIWFSDTANRTEHLNLAEYRELLKWVQGIVEASWISRSRHENLLLLLKAVGKGNS